MRGACTARGWQSRVRRGEATPVCVVMIVPHDAARSCDTPRTYPSAVAAGSRPTRQTYSIAVAAGSRRTRQTYPVGTRPT